MTLQIQDRVKETTTTTGTGALSLAGAVTGFQSFGAVCSNGDTCYYALQAVNTAGTPTGAWEVGLGGYTTSGNTLTRIAVLSSSNSGALVSLPAGTTQVWMDLPAGLVNVVAGKNPIINGGCIVNQRNAIAATTGVSTYGGPDRYLAANQAGGQFNQSLTTITYGGITLDAIAQTVITANTAFTGSNYWFGISQPIEGYNAYNLLGKPVTVSTIFSTNVTGTFAVALRDGTGANSFVSTFSAVSGVPVKITIPIASLPTSLVVPQGPGIGMFLNIGALNTGTFQAPTLNSWLTGDSFSASGGTNWGATAGNFIALTQLKIDIGVVATPFNDFDIGLETLKCQRYFYAMPSSTYEFASPGNTFEYIQRYDFPATMRIAPSMNPDYSFTENLNSITTISIAPDFYSVVYNSSTNYNSVWTLTFQASAEF
jgi:hypothetical protein